MCVSFATWALFAYTPRQGEMEMMNIDESGEECEELTRRVELAISVGVMSRG